MNGSPLARFGNSARALCAHLERSRKQFLLTNASFFVNSSAFLEQDSSDFSRLPRGVTGNTPDSGSGKSRFEP